MDGPRNYLRLEQAGLARWTGSTACRDFSFEYVSDMTTGLYLLLLFLQHGHCEEDLLTTENKTLSVSTSEESCELLAETCTYTLPMLEKERDYEQCQVTSLRK